jgi:TFIIF-interacting CTD phosphatase-like protein
MGKITIFLDLDETIVSSQLSKKFKFNEEINKVVNFIFHNMENYYMIFERPHLQEFLDYIFKNFYVCVWTAASKDYAFFIIKNIILKNKLERKIHYVFFEEHCDISEKLTNKTKNLEILYKHFNIKKFKNLKHLCIIDDNIDVFKSQPNNCIRAKTFEYEDKDSDKDCFLKELKDNLILLKKLDVSSINNKFEKYI